MKIRFSLFGYNKKEVEDKFYEYERMIELQKKDIDFLKRDNAELRSFIKDDSVLDDKT